MPQEIVNLINANRQFLTGKVPAKEEIDNVLDCYQRGDYKGVLSNVISILNECPGHIFSWQLLGAGLMQLGRLQESLLVHEKWIQLQPKSHEAHNNKGTVLKELARFEEAKKSYLNAIAFNTKYEKAYFNLGNLLKDLNKYEDAEAYYLKAINLRPKYFEAYHNYAQTLISLERLDEAELYYLKAINSNPNYAIAYTNLGLLQLDKGQIEKAYSYLNKAIELDPQHRPYHYNLSAYYYEKSEFDSSLASLERTRLSASESELKLCTLASLAVSSKQHGRTYKSITEPIILSHPVDDGLVKYLYQLNGRDLSMTKDARYGHGKCSIDFDLFNDESLLIKSISNDLIVRCENELSSNIFIYDSFFNIYDAGAGTTPHDHLLPHDKYFGLAKRKFSLVYYLDVGDQNCDEPGTLKIYNPDFDILPSNGMIVIMGANIKHSAIYSGKKDRVMIGMNFYCI